MSPLVSFRQVSARIGQKDILYDLSFNVEAGETLVLLGRSGSGKTTALKMVNGLLLPSAGDVLIEGKPTTAWDLIRLRRRIGYVIQDAGLFPHFTVAANVGLVPRLEGWRPHDIDARVAAFTDSGRASSGAVRHALSPRVVRRSTSASGGRPCPRGRSAVAVVGRTLWRA